MWSLRRYTPGLKAEWDAFVEKARNATFLFKRDYMDYHSDRFADRSLMAYRNGRLSAVLPANIKGQTLWSHQGLTYGGWAVREGLDTTDFFLLWREWLALCEKEGVKEVVYKPLPYIYASMPSQEDLYMLFLSKAALEQTDISSAISLGNDPGFNTLQKRHLKRAEGLIRSGWLEYPTMEEIEAFHSVVERCLTERHGTAPVHSAAELKLLADRFPHEITFWEARHADSDEIMAAICLYNTRQCAHCQYIATTEEGRALNALAPLVSSVIDFCRSRKRMQGSPAYLDFGISNEDGGLKLNAGLNRQKTSYGASGVACQRFRFSVSDSLNSLPASLWP